MQLLLKFLDKVFDRKIIFIIILYPWDFLFRLKLKNNGDIMKKIQNGYLPKSF